MTEEQYHKSIETNELQLSWGSKLSYFILVLFCSFMPLVVIWSHIASLINGVADPVLDVDFYFVLIPIPLGYLIYYFKKRSLKFKIVTTCFTRFHLLDIINEVGKQRNWNISHPGHNEVFAEVNSSYLYDDGEQVTILFYGNEVLINRLCDLNIRYSALSFSLNQESVEILIQAIKQAEILGQEINT
jgi:hypothetical protein